MSSDQEFLYELNRVLKELDAKVQAARICGVTAEQVIAVVADANVKAANTFASTIAENERRAAELTGNRHLQTVKPDAQRPAYNDGHGQRAA